MHIILSILLYLNVLSSPGTYTTRQVDVFEQVNQTAILQIEQQPVLLNNVVQTFGPEADAIVIIDTNEY
jgi:hypothetical protein